MNSSTRTIITRRNISLNLFKLIYKSIKKIILIINRTINILRSYFLDNSNLVKPRSYSRYIFEILY